MRVAPEPIDRGMVVPSPLGWEPIPARRRRPWRWVAGVAMVMAVTYAVLNVITVPYYGLLPGDAEPVDGAHGAITLGAAHLGSGNIFFATVFEQRRVSEWDRLTYRYTHPDRTLLPAIEITGGQSPAQYNQANEQAMSDSQEFAKVAALRRLGYTVPELGDGALVVEVQPGSPAAGNLKDGDIITAIDGKPVKIAPDATADIRSRRAGDTVSIDLKRPTVSGPDLVHLQVKTMACGAACPGDARRPFVGVALITDNMSFTLPPTLKLNIVTRGVEGPSAGLAFTLGALDALTTHDITGGQKVAATGTIDPDGVVGEVGGARQKTIAVEAAGCDYFIVPRAEFATAAAQAKGHHLRVVSVDNLEQALTFLRTIHGDLNGIPTKPPPLPADD